MTIQQEGDECEMNTHDDLLNCNDDMCSLCGDDVSDMCSKEGHDTCRDGSIDVTQGGLKLHQKA